MKDAEGPWPHAISLQDLQAHGPVQGVIRLKKVKEYCMKDLLLYQFDLEVDDPHSSTCPEPMDGVMVGYGGGESVI